MKNKGLKKMMSSIAAGAMALTVLMGSALTAGAAEGWNAPVKGPNDAIISGAYMEGTEANPAVAYISKNLRMAEGMNTPPGFFGFQFTKDTEDGGNPTNAMPEIEVKEIEYSAGEEEAVNGLIQSKALSGNIVAGLNFGHAGEYVYTVTEKTVYRNYVLNPGEKMKYSQAQYKMTVAVANKAGGNGTYVKYVAVEKQLDDNGVPTSGKVNPENNIGTNEFIFTNTFTRVGDTVSKFPGKPGVPGSDPNDPTSDGDHLVDLNDPDSHSALEIRNTVTGNGADLTKPFEFKLTLTKSATEEEDVTEYPAYLYKKTGEKVKIMVKVGEATKFELLNGEKLVFPTLPTGTRYTVAETGKSGYTTELFTRSNGGSRDQESDNLLANNKLIGDEDNYAHFYNDKPLPPITGILVNNLPFILLIGAAVFAFAGYLVMKKHKRA